MSASAGTGQRWVPEWRKVFWGSFSPSSPNGTKVDPCPSAGSELCPAALLGSVRLPVSPCRFCYGYKDGG